MIATSILLNLNEASWAELNQAGVLSRPLSELSLNFQVQKADSLSLLSCNELFLSAVGVDTEAILLSEVTAAKRTRVKETRVLHGAKGFIKGKSVELRICLLIGNRPDFDVINDLATVEMRALHADQVKNLNDNGDAFSGHDGLLMAESRVLGDLHSEIPGNASCAELMSAIEHDNNVIEFAVTNAAFVILDRGSILKGLENIFQLRLVDTRLLLIGGFEHKVEEALVAQVRILIILNRINEGLFPL